MTDLGNEELSGVSETPETKPVKKTPKAKAKPKVAVTLAEMNKSARQIRSRIISGG